MSSSERSIPHLRDIFGLNSSHGGYTMHHHHHHHLQNNYQQQQPPQPQHNHHHLYANSSPSTNNNQYQNGNSVNGGGGGLVVDSSSPLPLNPDPNFNNKKNSKKRRDNCKTLTSGDVKTLERHLSMKKTIRKKIMRDLQQAFVDDPNEFRIENSTNQEQLKAEIRVEAFRFGNHHHHNNINSNNHHNYNENNKTTTTRKSDNFLDMLRGEKITTQTTPTSSPSTQSTINNNYDYGNNSVVVQNRDYDYDSPAVPAVTAEKQSFWRRFTMKNKTKR